MGLKLIRLEMVRSKEADLVDHRHSYVFQASLTADGHLQLGGYSAVSHLCKVVKSEPAGHREGFLVLTSDGWALSCKEGDTDCALNWLEFDVLARGNYLKIAESDGVSRLFKVVSVEDAKIEVLHS